MLEKNIKTLETSIVNYEEAIVNLKKGIIDSEKLLKSKEKGLDKKAIEETIIESKNLIPKYEKKISTLKDILIKLK